MNLGLWGALLANRKRDPQLVVVSIGLGVVVTGAAISYGLRHLDSGRGEIHTEHVPDADAAAGWTIWCRAFWPAPARQLAPDSSARASPLAAERPVTLACTVPLIMLIFRRDVRFGIRIMLRTPVITACVIIVLALGIGANSAMFSIVDGLLLHPVSYPQPETLAFVWSHDSQGSLSDASAGGFHGLARAIENSLRFRRVDAHLLRLDRRRPPAPNLRGPGEREFLSHAGRHDPSSGARFCRMKTAWTSRRVRRTRR